jgi:calcineurin-like phosphoesterase
MCGSDESVIGREMLPVLQSMKLSMPQKLEIASGDIRVNGRILIIHSHFDLTTTNVIELSSSIWSYENAPSILLSARNYKM